jgi:hypothetical protein
MQELIFFDAIKGRTMRIESNVFPSIWYNSIVEEQEVKDTVIDFGDNGMVLHVSFCRGYLLLHSKR